MQAAYELGANAYIVKPALPSQLERIVRLIKQFWLDRDGPPPDCKEWQAVIVPAPRPAKANVGGVQPKRLRRSKRN